jgi:type I restriction enzyme S subunit
MSFPRYPEYKATGLEWPTEAPAHWKPKRLKFVVQLNPSRSEVSDRDRSEEVSFLPMEAVGDDGSLSLEQTRPIAAVETGYTYFRDGDVTIAKITPCFENGKGAVMSGLRGGIGFGTTELIVARPRPGEVVPEYLHSVFTSASFRGFGEASMYGAGGQRRVSDDFVRNFRPPMPPLPEQAQIQNFLARETAKIDALVAEQERLIELLEEKRQAVISHAVTKGLDAQAPMKDSSVEWLADIPYHWRLMPLSRIAVVDSGATPDRGKPSYWNGDIPWVKTGEINYSPIFDTEEHITRSGLMDSATRVAPAGTLLMAMYGQGQTRGRVALLGVPAAYNQACAAIRFGEQMNPEFALYFFKAAYPHIRDTGNETSQMNLGTGQIGKIKIPVPPLEEQDEIVAYLRREVGGLETLVRCANQARELLGERRAALISAAVTGQIDVLQLEAA